MIYIFLADGFETIEALAPLDMLRRANIDVKTVGIGSKEILSSHNVKVSADISESEATFDNLEGIILPGGSKGTENLENSSTVRKFIDHANKNKLLIAAICAAPSVLGKNGLLKDVSATAYPSFAEFIDNYDNDNYVVSSKNIITARGAGVSVDFGLEIVKYLSGENISEEIRESIQCMP